MKRSAVYLLTIIFLTLFMCTRDFSVFSGGNMDRELTSLEKELTSSSSEFGFQVFKKILQNQPDSNLFISPLSISMALGMTYNGAEGQTEEVMRTTLGYENLTDQQINKNYASLINLLTNKDEEVRMDIANSIWIRDDFPVLEDFIELNKKYFFAKVANLDFSTPEAVEIINEWVSRKTHGKIDKMITSIDPQVVMYLINAIYFKAYWQYPFDAGMTGENWFFKQNGDSVLCSFMQQNREFLVLEKEHFLVLDLLYGQGDFSMSLILPKNGHTVSELMSYLDKNEWDSMVEQFDTRQVTIEIPKFTLEYTITLNEVLTSLGMGIAFDENRADFSDINPDFQLFISKVLHKSFIEVDEEGTEAAAATSVEISLTSVPATIRFNHPFLFVIRERESNTVLFMGALQEPPVDR